MHTAPSTSPGRHVLPCSSEGPQWDQAPAAHSSEPLNNIPWSSVSSSPSPSTDPWDHFPKEVLLVAALVSLSAPRETQPMAMPDCLRGGRSWELRNKGRAAGRVRVWINEGALFPALTLCNICVT